MLQRDVFSSRAMKAICIANNEAQQNQQKYIGTIDLLIGLIKEGVGLAAYLLKKNEIYESKVRKVLSLNKNPLIQPIGMLCPNKPLEKILINAQFEAIKQNDSVIKTEHLLSSLCKFKKCNAFVLVLGPENFIDKNIDS